LEEIIAITDGPMDVMMTGCGSVESAVSFKQMGAIDYVVKPFSFEQIEVVVDKVASFDKMRMATKYYVNLVFPILLERANRLGNLRHW
jgi:DNA-binding NtrC family response regulator